MTTSRPTGSKVFLVPPIRPKNVPGHFHHGDDYRIVKESASKNSSPHTVVENPREADIILFIGSLDHLNRDITRHRLAREFPTKTVLYCSNDWVAPFLPGIYPGLPAHRQQPGRTCSGHYLRWSDEKSIKFTDPETTPIKLFGFAGNSENHPVRKKIFQLPQDDALLRDTRNDPARGYGLSPSVYARYRELYAEELANVRFVLCPAGVAPNSMRIYEAMKAARVPVIISEYWAQPPGLNWDRFCVRISERQVHRIPAVLEEIKEESAAMGREARQAWEKWFSPEQSFHVLATYAEQLLGRSYHRERVMRTFAYRFLFDSFPLRVYAAQPAKRLLRSVVR